MRDFLGTQLSTTRERRAAKLSGRLLLVGRSVLVEMLVFRLRLPVAEVIFCVVQNLAGLSTVGVGLTLVAWDYGGIVQELEEAAAMAGQDDLLLGSLDRGEEFGIVRLLELLTGLTQSEIKEISLLAPRGGGYPHDERQ
jgi:hypothetical protein